jgi:hypothetical protein
VPFRLWPRCRPLLNSRLDSPGGLREIVELSYSKRHGFGEGIECVSIGESNCNGAKKRFFRIMVVPCAAGSGVSDKSDESSVPSDNLKIGKAIDVGNWNYHHAFHGRSCDSNLPA